MIILPYQSISAYITNLQAAKIPIHYLCTLSGKFTQVGLKFLFGEVRFLDPGARIDAPNCWLFLGE
jgi:hypothetical protein